MSLSFETSLFAHLSNDAGVKATAANIYPLRMPQDRSLPAISYRRPSTHKNWTQTRESLDERPLDLNCWGRTYDEALTVADAVIAALGQGQSPFRSVLLTNETDLEDPELGVYRRLLSFTIWTDL